MVVTQENLQYSTITHQVTTTTGLHYFGTDGGVKVFGNDRWGMIFLIGSKYKPNTILSLIKFKWFHHRVRYRRDKCIKFW